MAVFLPVNKLDEIKRQMERAKPEQAKLWWVTETDGTSIAEQEDDNISLEDSFNELKGLLENMEGDWVYVTIRSKRPNKDEEGNYKRGANTKGVNKMVWRVRFHQGAGSGSQQVRGIGSLGDIAGLYEKLIDMSGQLAEAKLNGKIEALEAKIAQKGKEGPWEAIANRVVDKLFEAYDKENPGATEKKPVAEKTAAPGSTTSKPADPEKPLTEEEKKEQSKRMVKSITDLGNVLGRESYDLLENLAQRAKDNPDLFKIFAKKAVDMDLNLKDLIKP
jgi:hypothetical protein